MSGHWTDEDLIQHIYGIGPEDAHIEKCFDCQERLSAMQASRIAVERPEEVSFELLAAQRRNVYARVSQPVRWNVRGWVSVAATVLVIAGGLIVYEQDHHKVRVSDTQLALDASRMAADSVPDAAAPLKALFQE